MYGICPCAASSADSYEFTGTAFALVFFEITQILEEF
jgi:hypothetical protein